MTGQFLSLRSVTEPVDKIRQSVVIVLHSNHALLDSNLAPEPIHDLLKLFEFGAGHTKTARSKDARAVFKMGTVLI